MTPSEIQPGMKFNHWTVIKYSYTNSHRIKYFLCKCDCGTEREIRGTALIQGTSKACCKNCADEIIGQRFGKWTVLKNDKSRPRYVWCRCDCGTERSVFKSSLTTGKTKSCGCGKNIKTGMKEETLQKYLSYVGQQLNNITILSFEKESGLYICKCFCGKEFKAAPQDIISGNTTSCGCKRKETLIKQQEQKYSQYINKKIHKLTIQKSYYKNNTFWFDCLCDCGKSVTYQATKVLSEYVQSCGCLKSKAEENMEQLLLKEKICYKREYKFDSCRDKMPLPFDFAIFNKEEELVGLIELNGQQHYIEGGWNTKEHLAYITKHDQIKHKFCEEAQIPLLVIPYQYFNGLEKFLKSSDFWAIIKNFND